MANIKELPLTTDAVRCIGETLTVTNQNVCKRINTRNVARVGLPSVRYRICGELF